MPCSPTTSPPPTISDDAGRVLCGLDVHDGGFALIGTLPGPGIVSDDGRRAFTLEARSDWQTGGPAPVVHWSSLGPSRFQFSDPVTKDLNVVEYATGDVSWLATGTTLGSLLPGGTHVLARGPGLYGSVLVGPPGGPLTTVALASDSLLVMGVTHSPDGRWIVVDTFDIASSPAGGVLQSTSVSGGPAVAHVRLEPGGAFEWLDDRHAVAKRMGAPPPYRFQNGLYLLTVP